MSDNTNELERLRACARLNRETDAALEHAQRRRHPLATTLRGLMPILLRHCAADAVWIRTRDEDMCEADFTLPEHDNPIRERADDAVVALSADPAGARACEAAIAQVWNDGRWLLSQALDVDGEVIGHAGVLLGAGVDEADRELRAALLDVWCEELDGYLSAIARARAKHQITMAIGRALKHPVLDLGISAAVDALSTEVPFDDLILVYGAEGATGLAAVNYRIVRRGGLRHCSLRGTHARATPEVEQQLLKVLSGDRDAMRAMGLTRYREDALVSGRLEEQVIGRLVVGRDDSTFNTFERDLIERFADYLRHRIVDFNREWRTLARSFPEPVVARLLAQEGYRDRYLSPREEHVVVLYGDISGFTRLSEQVLREPARIGAFVDAWSRGVVEILWRYEAVFDKMIGDCIIGMWGPPFFDIAGQVACERALAAAVEIRQFTARLAAAQPELIADPEPVGIAIGINYCPLLVGLFGPNDNYTGFSSGMNNAARLQGLARRDEILCMENLVECLGQTQRFLGPQAAEVKNVAAPIRYRALDA